MLSASSYLTDPHHKLRLWELIACVTSELFKMNTHFPHLHIYSWERVLWVPLQGSYRDGLSVCYQSCLTSTGKP